MRTLLVVSLVLGCCATVLYAEDPPKDAKAPNRDKPYGPPNPAWLTPSVVQAAIDLPALVDLPKDEAVPPKDDPGSVVVTLGRSGRIGVRGSAFDLGSVDPGVQDDNILALRTLLERVVPATKHRNPDGTSRVRAVLCIDRAAPWKHVQWIMQAFASPKVKVVHIVFPVRRSETATSGPVAKKGEPSRFGRIDVALPTDRGMPAVSPPRVKLKVFRRDMGDLAKAYTLIKIDRERQTFSLPRGWKGFLRESPDRADRHDAVLGAVRTLVEQRMMSHGVAAKQVQCEIVAPPPKGGAVPFGDVIRLVHLAQQLGMGKVMFEGAATPLTRSERAARNAIRSRKQGAK